MKGVTTEPKGTTYLLHEIREPKIHPYHFQGRWAFTNYVDKTKSVGSTGNVNVIKIFPSVKEFLHRCQSGVGKWSKNAKVMSN